MTYTDPPVPPTTVTGQGTNGGGGRGDCDGHTDRATAPPTARRDVMDVAGAQIPVTPPLCWDRPPSRPPQKDHAMVVDFSGAKTLVIVSFPSARRDVAEILGARTLVVTSLCVDGLSPAAGGGARSDISVGPILPLQRLCERFGPFLPAARAGARAYILGAWTPVSTSLYRLSPPNGET